MKNRLLTLFAAMLCTYNAWSQVFFEYNNINYRVDGTDEVTVISTSYLAATTHITTFRKRYPTKEKNIG